MINYRFHVNIMRKALRNIINQTFVSFTMNFTLDFLNDLC